VGKAFYRRAEEPLRVLQVFHVSAGGIRARCQSAYTLIGQPTRVAARTLRRTCKKTLDVTSMTCSCADHN
jgi:hypothetical protein